MSGERGGASRAASRPLADAEGELLVRHCRGDGTAFPELVQRYRRRVYGYLVRCGVAESARDDVFQDVFVTIHNGAAGYQPERPLRPWLMAIVANVVRTHHRRTRVPDLAASDASPLEDGAADCHALAEARETALWLDRMLARLPAAQRDVVVLCCIEQLPQEEVAAALEMPVNTVKTHLRRARIALAQALARRNAALRREVSA